MRVRGAEPRSTTERLLFRAYRVVSQWIYGYDDPLFSLFVRKNGLRRVLRLIPQMVSLNKALARQFGEVEWQLLVAFTAMWAGCRWCYIGHVYSANLALFRDESVFTPMDERNAHLYQLMNDERLLEELRTLFSGPRWERLRYLIERHYALRTEAIEPENEDDELLCELLAMWDWVTECSIELMDTDPLDIPAVSGHGRDRELVARYHEARRRADREREQTES